MTNIKISNRLKAIADLVDKNSNIIDIGCDHALLDIYLIKNKIVKNCIASDLRETALKIAKDNIIKYNIKNIDVRCGNGLDVLNKNDKIDIIIMSGLGSTTITNILIDNKEILSSIKTIIIQSNNHVCEIRKDITKLGFYIEDERLVLDKNIIYTIIKFNKGKKKYTNKEYFLGPILLKNKDDLFIKKIKIEISKNNKIINKLNFKNILLKIRLKKKTKILKKEIRY